MLNKVNQLISAMSDVHRKVCILKNRRVRSTYWHVWAKRYMTPCTPRIAENFDLLPEHEKK